jgi:agmatinase
MIREELELIRANPAKIVTFFASSGALDVNAVVNSIKTKNVYVTIDLDGFDPSVIPHVGTPEPGGLSWYDGINLLEGIFNKFNVVAADIVELAPVDNTTMSDFIAAKLLYKLFGLKCAQEQ